jgi:hypothetical protein
MSLKRDRALQENASAEESIAAKTRDIQLAFGALGRTLEKGDETNLLYWVIPYGLACAHRPLRHHPRFGGSGRNLSPDASPLVIQWAARVRAEGIRSIISLMHTKDLAYYANLELGAPSLLDFYRDQGLVVEHLPWEDPHHSRTAAAEKEKKLRVIRVRALAIYDSLPKPALLQCSAGIDRSAPVAAFIHAKRAPA